MDDAKLLHELKCLALGRLFMMGSRPFQEGDIEEYARLRELIVGGYVAPWSPNWVRDRLKGAPGD